MSTHLVEIFRMMFIQVKSDLRTRPLSSKSEERAPATMASPAKGCVQFE